MNDCQHADKILTYYNYLKIKHINILKSVTSLSQKNNIIVTSKHCVDNAEHINKL
jgi:hypothetical protein